MYRLRIVNPPFEGGFEDMELEEKKELKVSDSSKTLKEQVWKDKRSSGIMIMVTWNTEDWGNSGMMQAFFKNELDPEIRIFNQILSTFKFY